MSDFPDKYGKLMTDIEDQFYQEFLRKDAPSHL